MLVRLLESRLLSPLSQEDDLIQESRVLAGRARTVQNETEFTVLDNDLRRLRERVEARAERNARSAGRTGAPAARPHQAVYSAQ
jgi:hypothetical protein